MADKPARSGYKYQKAVRALKAKGDQQCWRCGKWLSADAKWPARNCITLGHIIALEDGGDPYDPSNHAAECVKCNMGDGARRTNAKRADKEYQERRRHTSRDWYTEYQVGKPMVFAATPKPKPEATVNHCTMCGAATRRRKYCSNECGVEAKALYMRDYMRNRYRARVGIPTDAPLHSRAATA